ncbi:hypothetical protein [uncultured Roseibium sp.]|uniref:hypothetical protein n=1 Tax=uncultured Roseibium sp. TaxID=1936171 RepID=UPI00260F1425|nr:hypothetical protein [uncultured Roseibium sp.]
MAIQASRLHLLRRERHPLVAMAMVAFTLRLCLGVLATALSPDVAAASGLTSLCQTSSAASGIAAHDPALCQCGPVCAHGCATGSCLSPATPAYSASALPSDAMPAKAHRDFLPSASQRVAAIRAPPLSLI